MIVHQFISIGRISTVIGDESTGGLLHHIRNFEPRLAFKSLLVWQSL